MLSGRLKFPFCLLLFLIFSDTSHAYQFGLQYQAESTYRNTVGSFLVIPVLSKSDWTLEAASAVFISSKDWEVFSNRLEGQWKVSSGISLGARLGHRVELPEPFSRSTLLGYLRLTPPSMGPLSVFFLGGWYYRIIQLEKMSVLPFLGSNSLSQQDFATELGVQLNLSSALSWKLAVATFDEMEVYNLNHPFVESSLKIRDLDSSTEWRATVRGQLVLGFGRLDRLIFGMSYSTRL